MATAAPSTYTAPAGKRVVAGRVRYPNALLNLVAAAPPLTWVKANLNRIDAVFPIPDLTPLFGAGPSNQATIIRAWSSFGWDSNRSRLAIFGGGHANASSNELFVFDAMTRLWRLGFTSNDVSLGTGMATADGYRAPGGHLTAPISAHTYCNNNYLPTADRFITFGGAAHSSGANFVTANASGVVRALSPGGYTCDMGLDGQGFLGARTGDNVQRNTTVGLTLPGANAWKARDYQLDHAQAALTAGMVETKNGGTAVTQEGGVDVIYRMTGGAGATSLSLFRTAYPNIYDYKSDQLSQVGSTLNNPGSGGGGVALDTTAQVFAVVVHTDTPLFFWDLKTAGPSNSNKNIAPAGLTGPGAAEFLAALPIPSADRPHGMLYDPVRNRFTLWGEGGRVFAIAVPTGNPTPITGWTVTKLADPATVRPTTKAEQTTPDGMTGVHGKWKYAAELDLYVGVQHSTAGDVWVFRPENWIDPRT